MAEAWLREERESARMLHAAAWARRRVRHRPESSDSLRDKNWSTSPPVVHSDETGAPTCSLQEPLQLPAVGGWSERAPPWCVAV